jgi:hypothetical protein
MRRSSGFSIAPDDVESLPVCMPGVPRENCHRAVSRETEIARQRRQQMLIAGTSSRGGEPGTFQTSRQWMNPKEVIG